MQEIGGTNKSNYSCMMLRYCTNVCFTSTLEGKQAESYLRCNPKLANAISPPLQFGSTQSGHSGLASSLQAGLSKDNHIQRSGWSSSIQSSDRSCSLETWDVFRLWGGFTSKAASFQHPSQLCSSPSAAPFCLMGKEERGSSSNRDD